VSTRWTVYLATAIVTGAAGGVLLTPRPVAAVAREIVELQEDVKQLIQVQKEIETTLVRNAAVNKTLMEQSVSAVNKMTANMMTLEKTVQEIQTSSSARMDTMVTRLEASADNVQVTLGRTGKLNQQLVDLQNTLGGIGAKLADTPPASNGASPVPPRARTKH
jgi:hypothetical protein